MRCLSLAGELRRIGHDCIFISRELKGNMINYIADKGYDVKKLYGDECLEKTLKEEDRRETSVLFEKASMVDAEKTVNELSSLKIDLLVVDNYQLDINWEKMLSSSIGMLMVIDDFVDRPHYADIFLNQNLGVAESHFSNLLPAHCLKLLGPAYALLRPQFSSYRQASLIRRSDHTLRRINISMGGVDPYNTTASILRALETSALSSEVVIDVVMGKNSPWIQDIYRHKKISRFQVAVLVDVQNMAKLMSQADLSIGAGGGTSWERCALGVPSIVMNQALNQASIVAALAAAGAIVPLTLPFEKSYLHKVVSNLLAHPFELKSLSASAASICDGCGIYRVAKVIEKYV